MKIVNQKVELLDSMGSDLSVVNAARVSFHKESDWVYKEKPERCSCSAFNEDECLCGAWHPQEIIGLHEKDQKLLVYLAKHGHWSPFAHTSLQFRIKAPVFVARQLVKHQVGGVWNEISRRYVDDEPEFYFPTVWRGRPTGGAKQGSTGVVAELPKFVQDNSFLDHSLSCYWELLEAGVAPEQARMVLPQNTMTEWIWTGSLMFFARVCKQRLDAHAQAETREIAQMINDLIPDKLQYSWKALMHESD